MYSCKAIRFVQNGRVFYTAVIPAYVLVALTKVDVWNAETPDTGYQRAPSAYRKREIGRYVIQDDAIMPVGGLVNARPKKDEDAENQYGTVLQFVKESGNDHISTGKLTIPDDIGALFIVDMQHRLGGFEWALEQEEGEKITQFPLVVTIADGLSRLEEVDQFDLINTTQKKVRTDLARRLKVIQAKDLDRQLAMDQKGKLWEAKGPVICDILNKKPGVWFGRILPPNKSKREQPTLIMRETSFVTSLKPVLQTPYFLRQNEEHAAELLYRYWSALMQVFPEAFVDADSHVIQRTPGVFALHELAPEVFELARDNDNLSIEGIYQIVSNFRDKDGDYFWNSENEEGAAIYGSMKGFRILASILRQRLPSLSTV